MLAWIASHWGWLAVMVVLESMGMRLTVYVPLPPVTAPSEAETTSPVVDRVMV